jgi:O-antigen ligase
MTTMKKAPQTKSLPQNKQVKSEPNTAFTILLYAYLLIPLFTPNFYTLDSNGPKFLAIALLNMIALFVLFTVRGSKPSLETRSGFFRNYIGLAYTAFLIISLLSFTQSINLPESIINFAKLFTVFTSVYILYVIFSSNRGYVMHVALVLTALLLFDCLTVFYNIIKYINEDLISIWNIKSIYSNKNILASALFIKIPAAIWLLLFSDKWKKKLGYLAFFMGAMAVLFMSTRAFVLGLALLVSALGAYLVARHFWVSKKLSLKKAFLFAGILVVAFVAYTLTQQYLYPKNKDIYNTSLKERLATINADESSTNARLTNWKRSVWLIQDNPMLGVGSGNWKINVLKYESPADDNFIISYKNHNDFLEVAAETGIPGGLIYLSIFILILIAFMKAAFKRETDEETLKYLFLPAFGILAYSVDAFFNFPNDRPEIQLLFASYVALAISFSASSFSLKGSYGSSKPALRRIGLAFPPKLVYVFAFSLLVASVATLYLNTRSLHFQRYVFEDDLNNVYSHPSSFFIDGFPVIPTIGNEGAPVNTLIARYLMNENRYSEAANSLLSSNPSPFDGRREYYLAMAYDKMENIDSLLLWGRKCCSLKPLYPNLFFILSAKLYSTGHYQEADSIIDSYFSRIKTNQRAWLLAASQNSEIGRTSMALALIDTAVKYLPLDTQIRESRREILNAAYITPYEELYKKANQAYFAKQYTEASKLLNEFILKKPDLTEALKNRAVCSYFLRDYRKSLSDIETALSKGNTDEAFLINLRGVNYIGLGKHDAACQDFKQAMKKGSADGETNYRKFCAPAKKAKAEVK